MNKIEQAKEFFEKGEEAYNNENFEKAKECFEEAIKLYPNFAEAYYVIAGLLTNEFKDYKKAKKYYEKSIELNPKNIDGYNGLVYILIELEEYKKAKEFCDKAIKLDNNSEIAYTQLAFLLREHFPKTVKKISQITLKNYNQFKKDTVIDLTYPEGHDKAGEPLDRVCFIGQSGTGKTSLLELIKHYFFDNFEKLPNAYSKTVSIKFKTYEKETDISLINFPPYAVENIKYINEDEILNYKYEKPNQIIDFGKTNPKEHWYPILNENVKYQKDVINKSLLLRDKINQIIGSENFNKIKKEIEAFKKLINDYKEDDKNPLKKLDVFFKPLLSKFNLQISRTARKLDDLRFIPVENIWYNEENEEEIGNFNIEFQSTGTKQILSRLVPMFALKPKHTTIIIDEPENSLYPDMQKAFVEFLTNESWNEEKTCQFFFATHSPTIASSFDPWEIIALEFTENGKVRQKPFFEGERHVDNFTIHPKYLRWDDLFIELFDLKLEGDEERTEQLQKLAGLKRDVLSDNYNEEEKERKIKEYLKLAGLLKTRV